MTSAAAATIPPSTRAAAVQKANAQNPATTGASSSGTGAQGGNALGSLASNFNNFLTLLMTQLKNQDPSSPMDTNQFTNQLVQFSSVEQQINTNTSLTQLIQLTQASQVTQSSAILGKQGAVESAQIPLQGGSAALRFTAAGTANVSIAVRDTAGLKVRDATLNGVSGAQTWTWDGKDNTGRSVPDGAYTVAVTGGPAKATPTALPFTVSGTVTGVTSQNNTVNLQMGGLSVPFSAVRSVGN